MRTDRRDRPGDRPKPDPRRDEPRLVGDLLYGRNAVLEALRGRRHFRTLFLAEGIKHNDRVREMVNAAAPLGVRVVWLPRADLDRMAGPVNHQGIALESSGYPYALFEDLLESPKTILVLDHLQDPQNFGTLLRTAESVGVGGVVIPRDRAVDVTPAVVNASAGAVEHLHVAQVANLARGLEDLKAAGWWIAGLDTGPDALDLFRADLPDPLALVVGGEGAGIGHNVRRHCDLVLSIPMVGKIASLNAATAGSVALFELFRRQRG